MFTPDRISEEARGGNWTYSIDEDSQGDTSTVKGLLENPNFDLDTKDFPCVFTDALGKWRKYERSDAHD